MGACASWTARAGSGRMTRLQTNRRMHEVASRRGPEWHVPDAYNASNATFRALRAFGWGTMLNLGYYPFGRPITALNFVLSPVMLLAPFFRFPVAQLALIKRAMGLLRLAEGEKVLDVACGRGTSSFLMATMFPHLEVTGLDLLPGNLAAAETMYGNTPNLRYLEGDAMNIDLPSGGFDRLLCVEAAFQFPDRRRFMEEAWRVLAPGGVAVIVDFVWESDLDPLVRDDADTLLVRRVWQWEDFASVDEYRSHATESGFEIEAMYDWTNHVTAPLITILSVAAWFARTRLGQRVFATAIPGMRAFAAPDWRDLIDAARGHRHVQRHSRYVAFVLRRQP